MTPPLPAEAIDVERIGPFSVRWPDDDEHFESGWTYRLNVFGEAHRVRHGLGGRKVYGRERVHTVTWLDGEVRVEGVEADDYPTTGALLSLLRRPDKSLVRSLDEVPAEYLGFDLVEHRREIKAKWSRYSLAVKIRQDDLPAWGLHAWLRSRLAASTPPVAARAEGRPTSVLPPPPTLERRAVTEALLAHGKALVASLGGGTARFTPDQDANALIHNDPFAFLVAVICDQGILAERAWAIPHQLKQRLGHLDPRRLIEGPLLLRSAFAQPPKLHRFVNDVSGWVIQAASIALDQYAGDASRTWNDRPSAGELRDRFDAFPGIGQKKAAMAVEILERDLHVPLTDVPVSWTTPPGTSAVAGADPACPIARRAPW